MRVVPLHSWEVTPREAAALQRELRRRLDPVPPPGFEPRLVAGADLSVTKTGPRGFAGIVVLATPGLDTVAESSAAVTLTFPYIPGLLSFRELPAVAEAWRHLEVRPDVVIFDGQGYAHPRRFGLACHGGMLLDVPSIGCAKSLLVGRHGPLGERRGSTAPLVDGDETIGMAVRLREGVRPVYVSAGHRMDLPTAVGTVLAVSERYREPETTRRAHLLVNRLRAEQSGRGG